MNKPNDIRDETTKTLSEYLDFSDKPEESEKTCGRSVEAGPLAAWHVDPLTNCIQPHSWFDSYLGNEELAPDLYKSKINDLLFISTMNGKIDKFAIVDKANVGRQLLPNIYRIASVKEGEIPFIWTILQDRKMIQMIEQVWNRTISKDKYKSIFDNIITPTHQSKYRCRTELNTFVYSLALCASLGNIRFIRESINFHEFIIMAGKVLYKKDISYYRIKRKLNLVHCICPSRSVLVLFRGCDNDINSFIANLNSSACHSLTFAPLDIETVGCANTNDKIAACGCCVIPMGIIKLDIDANKIKSVLDIVGVMHLFVEGASTSDEFHMASRQSMIASMFCDSVTRINYLNISGDQNLLEEKIHQLLTHTRCDKAILLSSVFAEISCFTASNFFRNAPRRKKNVKVGHNAKLKNTDLAVFDKVKLRLLQKSHEWQRKVPADELIFDDTPGYIDVQFYKLKALDEEIQFSEKAMDIWKRFSIRCGNNEGSRNFARTLRNNKEMICKFKQYLPGLYDRLVNSLRSRKSPIKK